MAKLAVPLALIAGVSLHGTPAMIIAGGAITAFYCLLWEGKLR